MAGLSTLIPVYVVMLLLGVGVGFVVPILPLYAKALGATQFTIGFMGTAFTVAFTILAIPGGWLSDRFGRRKPFIAGLFCYSIVIYAMSMAGDVLTLIFLRGLQGAASAFIMPVAYAIIGNNVERRNLGKAMGLFGMLHGGGMAGGSVIGEFVSSQGFSFLFVVCSIIVLAATAVAFFTVNDAGKVFEGKKLILPNLRVIVKNKSLFPCFYSGGFVAGFIEVSMVTLAPAYLGIVGFSGLSIRLMFFFMIGSTLLSQMLAGWLSDRFGRLPILSIMLLVTGVSSILFTFSGSFFDFSSTMFLIGLSYSSAYPVALALISEMQKDALGSAMGVYSLMYGVGGSIGPAVAGVLADRFVLQAPYFLNGIMAFSAVILTLSILLQAFPRGG
jgi:DHA1 family multidrug resistance protein-like MFS transporter